MQIHRSQNDISKKILSLCNERKSTISNMRLFARVNHNQAKAYIDLLTKANYITPFEDYYILTDSGREYLDLLEKVSLKSFQRKKEM